MLAGSSLTSSHAVPVQRPHAFKLRIPPVRSSTCSRVLMLPLPRDGLLGTQRAVGDDWHSVLPQGVCRARQILVGPPELNSPVFRSSD